jgi:hypothetical protein
MIDYWIAVGRLMTALADVEANMQAALWVLARTDEPISKAVFSGTRIEQAMGFMRRCIEAEGRQQEFPEIEDVFAQLTAINRIRNDLVHYGPKWNKDSSSVNIGNRNMAMTPDRVVELRLTPNDLRLMCCDLKKINEHLFNQIIAPGFANEWQIEVMRAPWLYKAPSSNEGRTKPPKQQSQKK